MARSSFFVLLFRFCWHIRGTPRLVRGISYAAVPEWGPVKDLGDEGDSVTSIVYSPDGKRVASGGEKVYLWNVDGPSASWGYIDSFHPGTEVWSIDYSPDGAFLAVGQDQNVVSIWSVSGNPDEWKEVERLQGNGDEIASVVYSPDGKMLASGDISGKVEVWLLEKEKWTIGEQWPEAHQDGVDSMAFRNDGKYLATGGMDGKLKIWSINGGHQGSLAREFMANVAGGNAQTGSINCVAYTADGTHVVTAGADAKVKLWFVGGDHVRAWRQVSVLEAEHGSVDAVAFSQDGHHMITGGNDGAVKLWYVGGHDVKAWRELRELGSHESKIVALDFSPDATRVVGGEANGTVRVWHVGDNDLPEEIPAAVTDSKGTDGIHTENTVPAEEIPAVAPPISKPSKPIGTPDGHSGSTTAAHTDSEDTDSTHTETPVPPELEENGQGFWVWAVLGASIPLVLILAFMSSHLRGRAAREEMARRSQPGEMELQPTQSFRSDASESSFRPFRNEQR